MILSKDGYAITYDKQHNQIRIQIPQSFQTVTGTISPIVDRRTDVEEADLMALLEITMIIFHKEG